MKTFKKLEYTDKELEVKIEEIKKYFTNNLKKGYSLVNVQGSISNGLSVYAKVSRDAGNYNNQEFVFRISDHKNGNSFNAISDTGLNYQVQGDDLNIMYVFYGEVSRKDARINFLKDALKKYKENGKEGSNGFVAFEKELKKLTK